MIMWEFIGMAALAAILPWQIFVIVLGFVIGGWMGLAVAIGTFALFAALGD
jgi:hypothetical protein